MYEQAYLYGLLMRGVERFLIVGGAIFCCYLGYRLYALHSVGGDSTVEIRHPVYTFIISGQGPGLFFMLFGAVVMVYALRYGGGKDREIDASGEMRHDAAYATTLAWYLAFASAAGSAPSGEKSATSALASGSAAPLAAASDGSRRAVSRGRDLLHRTSESHAATRSKGHTSVSQSASVHRRDRTVDSNPPSTQAEIATPHNGSLANSPPSLPTIDRPVLWPLPIQSTPHFHYSERSYSFYLPPMISGHPIDGGIDGGFVAKGILPALPFEPWSQGERM